ncbi:cyclic AMP-dependent transcription factor ATF-7-like isoform X1 [Lampetra fluviatilis]
MSEDDKPFVCNVPGCGQSFTNEDHLSVHKHKHEMTLKFGPPKSDALVVADQTPTPTRFLKNCEEVGLFHELASPFDKLEHEFKKAQEEEDKKLVLGLPAPSLAEASSKDGEHVAMETSQPCTSSTQPEPSAGSSNKKEAAFPVVSEVALPLRPSSLLLPNPTRSPSMVIQQTTPSPNSPSVIIQAPSAHQQHVAPIPGSLPVILQLSNGQAVSVSLPASAATSPTLPVPAAYPEQQPIAIQIPAVVSNVPGIPGPPLGSLAPPSTQADLTTPPGSHQQHGVTTRLKAMLTEASPQNGGVEVLSQAVEMVIAQQDSHLPLLSLHIPQPQALSEPQPSPPVSTPGSSSSGCGGGSGPGVELSKSTSPAAAGGGRRRRSAITDPEERRRRFLERNRAAASRCRQKRKLWVMDLERRAEDLAHTNVELQKEVTELRGELAHLKQLLLAHKDCPVTALQKEAQAFLGTIMESQESTAAAAAAAASSNKSSVPPTETAEGSDRAPDNRLFTVDVSALSVPGGGGQAVSGSS